MDKSLLGYSLWIYNIHKVLNIMMTLSYWNIFRVTGPLWEKPLGCFLWSVPEQTVVQTVKTLLIWDVVTLIMTSLLCKLYIIFILIYYNENIFFSTNFFVFCFLYMLIYRHNILYQWPFPVYNWSKSFLFCFIPLISAPMGPITSLTWIKLFPWSINDFSSVFW